MLRQAENVQKRSLWTFPCIFWGGQLLGSGNQYNITPFGVSGCQFTMACTDIIAGGLTQRCDFCLRTTHSAAFPVKPAQWTSRNCWRHFIKLHFSHIMHFYQNFDLLRLLSCHMGSPDSLSHGFYCPYQIGFTLFNISIEFRRVKWVHLYTFQ